MKRINYFLFLGFIYLLQKVFLVFIFHVCILKFSPCIGGISLCYHSESFKGSEESPTLFIFKHMFGPLQAGSFPSHTIANHLFCWLLIHMHVYIELLVCLMWYWVSQNKKIAWLLWLSNCALTMHQEVHSQFPVRAHDLQ